MDPTPPPRRRRRAARRPAGPPVDPPAEEPAGPAEAGPGGLESDEPVPTSRAGERSGDDSGGALAGSPAPVGSPLPHESVRGAADPVRPHPGPDHRPEPHVPSPAPTGSPGQHPPRPPADRRSPGDGPRRGRPSGPENAERSLRSLVTTRSTQVSSTAAMRAREVAIPDAGELAEAEAALVIVRRHYVPPTSLTAGRRPDRRGGQGTGRPRSEPGS